MVDGRCKDEDSEDSMTEKIHLWPDSNETQHSRITELAKVASEDPRFVLEKPREQIVDLCFDLAEYSEDYPKDGGRRIRDYVHKILNVELKGTSDYIQSALGKEGHLYLQSLSMREPTSDPLVLESHSMILVLGGDKQISEAIMESLKTRYRGKELAFQIASYTDRLYDFEAKSYALGCPVMRWESSPWKRLLSHSHKILTEGTSLLDYRPRPDNERDVAALCVLCKGLGEVRARSLLQAYGSLGGLVSCMYYEKIHGTAIDSLCKVDGIGKVTARNVVEAI